MTKGVKPFGEGIEVDGGSIISSVRGVKSPDVVRLRGSGGE